VPEHGRAVAFDVLVESDTRGSLGQDHRCERGLADLKWIAAHVVAVQFDKVECVQEHVGVVVPVADLIEARHAVVACGDGLAVDDGLRGGEARGGGGLGSMIEGKNRIMIFGPKSDGTYVIEFRTDASESLAISIRGSEQRVIQHFQERMPYGLFVPDVDSGVE
jgi:hypothetical protein